MKKLVLCGLAALALAPAISWAQGPLILVNVSNPAAVTFTATDNAPIVNDSSQVFYIGIALANFFRGEPDHYTLSLSDSTLTTSVQGGPALDRFQVDNLFADPNLETGNDVALYRYYTESGSGDSEVFSTASRAFVGQGTVDFSLYADVLPAPGQMGDLYAGNKLLGAVSLELLGSYEVVPEPSTWVMLGIGAVGVGIVALRRRQIVRG